MRAFLIYALYRLLGALVGPLPPRAGYWLARRAGGLICRLSPNLQAALAHNMRHVLGPSADEETIRDFTRQACINVAKGHYELFRVSRLTTEEIQDLTEVEGFEYFTQAMELKKGVIAVTAHLGNVDLVAQLPLALGIPISGAAWHTEPERLFRYTLRLRQKHGVRLFPSDGPMIGLLRALKREEIIALPLDRDFADNTRFIDLFGEPARLPHGPVRLARRTGAPLLPAFVERLPDERFRIHVEPSILVPQTDDVEADIDATMKTLVSIMERHIAQRPAQWLVAAPVWPMDTAQEDGERGGE